MKKMNLEQMKLLCFVLNNLYSDKNLTDKEQRYFDKHNYKNNYQFDTIKECEKYIKVFLSFYPEYESFVNDYQIVINEYVKDEKDFRKEKLLKLNNLSK